MLKSQRPPATGPEITGLDDAFRYRNATGCTLADRDEREKIQNDVHGN